ncbi:Response regulator receiver domain-containing protein [Lachnospiraceae bacterium XBB1006]|nr:Response regulator receiver domain-containing protein [Lachnospiraceae bacterium XBB1006]
MADVLILEPHQGSLEKYKKMLHALESRITIWYTPLPEQAMEWINQEDIGVVITENDMGIMDANEFSDMFRLSNPNLVHILMTEVVDIPYILNVLNTANIYEIILKPFSFAEDLVRPIEEGLKEHERRKLTNGAVSSMHGSATEFAQQFDELRSENYKRTRDYSNLYTAFSGIVHGNLSTWGDKLGIREDEYIRIKYFVQEIVKHYVTSYIFSQDDFAKRKADIELAFANDSHKSFLKIQNNVQGDISQNKVQDIFFSIFLMAHLCKYVLAQYQIYANIDYSEGYYIIRIQSDPKYSMLNGTMVYKEQNEKIRQLMHEIVDACLKKVFVKSMKGYKDNPFVAVATTVAVD